MNARGLRLFGGLAFLASGSCPSAGETMDQLYQAAKAEGTVVLYGGGPATWYDPWVKKFEARFPGVKVVVRAGSSNVLADDIDAQIKAGNYRSTPPSCRRSRTTSAGSAPMCYWRSSRTASTRSVMSGRTRTAPMWA